LAFSPDGKFLYVTGGTYLSNKLSVIATATNTVTATIAQPSQGPVAVSPDGSYIYIANESGLTLIDSATNGIVTTIPVNNSGGEFAVSADGTRSYLRNISNGTVSVVYF